MNYLAHGYRFLDRPLFLAGTAIPDWLSVVDRRVRARARLVHAVLAERPPARMQEIGQGILQHHRDDDAFHRSALFMNLESQLSSRFREHMPDPFDHRPGFLGHIVVELMLDAHLIAADDSLLDRYYAALAEVPDQLVEDTVNRIAVKSTHRLAFFVRRFREERFLYDYQDDPRLLRRLNQVMHRVRLPPLTPDVIRVLAHARTLVQQSGNDLLQVVEQEAGGE